MKKVFLSLLVASMMLTGCSKDNSESNPKAFTDEENRVLNLARGEWAQFVFSSRSSIVINPYNEKKEILSPSGEKLYAYGELTFSKRVLFTETINAYFTINVKDNLAFVYLMNEDGTYDPNPDLYVYKFQDGNDCIDVSGYRTGAKRYCRKNQN